MSVPTMDDVNETSRVLWYVLKGLLIINGILWALIELAHIPRYCS